MAFVVDADYIIELDEPNRRAVVLAHGLGEAVARQLEEHGYIVERRPEQPAMPEER